MTTKRRPIHTPGPGTNMNFRPNAPDIPRSGAKGTRPVAPPTTIKEVLLMTVMHLCRTSIFYDTSIKVALYLGSLFLVSLLGDLAPFPKTYFARSDNLFNVYFVKIGWGWTLTFVVPFLVMTSYTLCCGDVKKMLRHHVPRILIATFFWFFWTKVFNIIENSYGKCTVRGFPSKSACLKAGNFWRGFDISGHAFILIHSSLVLIEEARPIVKWEAIKDYIRNELHNRKVSEYSSSSPLRNLSEDEIKMLNVLYNKFTPAINLLFIGMSALQILWDVMLVCTMVYYHKMIEKVLSGIIAILTWYFTYRFWYPHLGILPDAPGCGNFYYQHDRNLKYDFKRTSSLTPNSSRSSTNGAGGSAPKYTPLYAASTARSTKTTSGQSTLTELSSS